ncbi:hypothetical protein BJY01DRAFT_257236 [Aspergillus pseudoustus]|uniref:Integral membrane protein n=1 Tax=Aspergillus pseudoustus TaxID=1810923 RepID=A0ABR4JM24_9EURO
MSYPNQYPTSFPPPPPVPPRTNSTPQAPGSTIISRRPVPSAGPPAPPPVPVASRPAVAAPTNILDDPDVITYCPGDEALLCTAYWYTAPDAPVYEICSYCFASHIRNTHWASRFQRQLKQSDPDRRCRFETPRMLHLWPQVLRNDDWAYISRFMAQRAAIPDCKKSVPVSADSAISRYSLRNKEIENLVICSACYEDYALATSFAGSFIPQPTGLQAAGQMWSCDMTRHMRRAIVRYAASNDWSSFIRSVGHSMKLAPCEKAAGVAAASRKWFRPKPHIPGMVICDACYYAFIAASFMEVHFEPAPVDILNGGLSTWVCDLSLLPTMVVQIKAEEDKNYQIFWDAAKAIMANPPCPSAENASTYEGTWYALRSAGNKVCVCTQCYAGLIYPFGFGSYFTPLPRSPQALAGIGGCIFNEKSPRRTQYLNKTDEAVSLRTFTHFQNFASTLGVLPVCQTTTAVNNRRWYGNDDCLICESCWEEFARRTSLASQLPYQGKFLASGICDMYSARMRGLWLDACKRGNTTEFMAFARHRSAVYQQTVPRMQEILAYTKMRMEQRQTALLAGVMMTGASNVVGASQAVNYTTYGNASVGYGWATMSGAQGAQMLNQGMGMNVVDGGEMMQVAQLEKMWKEVE